MYTCSHFLFSFFFNYISSLIPNLLLFLFLLLFSVSSFFFLLFLLLLLLLLLILLLLLLLLLLLTKQSNKNSCYIVEYLFLVEIPACALGWKPRFLFSPWAWTWGNWACITPNREMVSSRWLHFCQVVFEFIRCHIPTCCSSTLLESRKQNLCRFSPLTCHINRGILAISRQLDYIYYCLHIILLPMIG